ncbi:MAG: mandelate racemase/muconate lactonizing enzyme family protein [Pseudomonadota bacterium]|uniref:mandelate racemase/muconate lactonizing enzyme family protein n=1 Tax=Roseovarius TaxID=74030 RepID=UPI0022A67D2B|nr:mandelate racemase/muconate lactonizing enzyme family protein [Roseovarius sp. EGI FJ00037]MCZ0811715.1 mandelate racemase/muconate lactonizing enzyme family protein [Roseovarius sp. EGI FJ00037]
MIERINVDVFRAPVTRPVATSFGVMRDRPAVFVRLEDSDGAFGWGEIFANWPSAGAEHRARLLIEDMADLVLGRGVGAPGELWAELTRQTHVRALQCGEWGPFRQVIAGLDTAAHDLLARRAGVPLAAMLAPGGAAEAVPVYASGLHVSAADDSIAAARAAGIRAFKVKIGFDAARDLADLRMLCADLRAGERLMADANQAWTLSEALEFTEAAGDLGLSWLEEPIGADAPAQDWLALAQASRIPLAAGENIVGHSDFTSVVQGRAVAVLQPDVAKWGGVSGCLGVAREALEAGLNYCPHFLGGGVGLAASAHLLAAAGGPGMLELDANDNPLRDAFFPGGPAANGDFTIATRPGLGIETLPEEIARYRTLSLESAHS